MKGALLTSLMITSIASMFGNRALEDFMDDEFGPVKKIREAIPRNKYGLTEEEIKSMETLTPKEKKKFLKGRSHA